MERAGDFLKTYREEAGISLQTMSDKTKLKVRLLEDIENNQFRSLGGRGYARAMVVTYCRELQADMRKALFLFDREFPNDVNESKAVINQPVEPSRIMLSTRFFGYILLVLVVLVLGYTLWRIYQDGSLDFEFFRNKTEPAVEAKPPVKAKPVVPKKEVVIPEPVNSDLLKQTAPAQSTPAGSASTVKRDTTDYVDKLLFERRDSPLNVKDTSVGGH